MSGHDEDLDEWRKSTTYPGGPHYSPKQPGEKRLSAKLVNTIVQGRNETDPTGRAPNEPGAKLDAGKIMPWLMLSGFANAMAEIAKVTTVGANKYTPNGWRTVPNGRDRYLEAFARHALALARGEEVDADTGCLHLAQMAWNLLAALELELAPPLLEGGE